MVATLLTAGAKAWAKVDVESVTARGLIAPRLVFWVTLSSPTERIAAELRDLRVQVVAGDEVLGEGRLISEPALWHGTQCELEVPTDHRLLDYVTARLGREAHVRLVLRWKGLMRVTWSPGPSDPRMQDDPQPDVPTDLRISYGQWIEQHLNVPRSDWFTKVLQPTRHTDFLYMEVAIPRGPEADRWAKALVHLGEAEKAFAMGDDPGVFSKLRAVFEALPGANKNIFDALPPNTRNEIDALAKAFVTYLHHGRHVATAGPNSGEFPVGRLDADLALSISQVILSYASRALACARGL